MRGRELRQTARKNIVGNAISKSAGLENTANQNLTQMGFEIDALANNDIHRAMMQDQQEKNDFLDQLDEKYAKLKGLVKPVQINQAPINQATQAQIPTGESVKVDVAATEAPETQPITQQTQPATVGTPQATDATVETPAPGQPAQIQSAPKTEVEQEAKQEEPDYSSMSYNDAFRAARKLKGKDGTFE